MAADGTSPQLRALDDAVLRSWPLPMPSSGGDQQDRGYVLVIGGSREMPGAAVLAATAALRAGSGKLAIATAASVASVVALAVPEARVLGLPETRAGGIAATGVQCLEAIRTKLDAVLIGPGMQDEDEAIQFVCTLLPQLGETKVILDALAMNALHSLDGEAVGRPGCASDGESEVESSLLVTPHAGEMAHLTQANKDEVRMEASAIACAAASRFKAVVALKGATTYIAVPGQHVWKHDGGNIGLAISGSGDVLAGIIAGLAARGASVEQAAAWGVALHARAGERLAQRMGPLGYLAREILVEIPALMHALGCQ